MRPVRPSPYGMTGTSVTICSTWGSELKPPSVRSTRATGSATETRVLAAPSRVVAAQVGRPAGRRDARIVRGVRQEERLARGDDGAGQTLADLDLRVGHGCLGIAPDALEHEIIAIHHSDAHRVRVEERPARLGHL